MAILLAAVVATTSPARADAVVTLCHSADESGPGTNLLTALQAAPDPNTLINTITFQCGGSATIQVLAPLEIFQATKIDGGDAVTLVGNNTRSLIVVADPGNFLYLYNLTLRHPTAQRLICINWMTSGCQGRVVAGQGVTELHHVQIDSTPNAIAVSSGTLTIDDSQFTGNSEVVIVAAPKVSTTTITRSLFQGNSASPIEAVGTVSIADTRFINNSHSMLGAPCAATIDRSEFQGNQDGFGGALTVNCNATISHTLLANNVATGFGGAIWIFPGAATVTLRADNFKNNSAGPGGGAIFWVPAPLAVRQLNIQFSNFTGNKGTVGGAIDLESPGSATGKSVIMAQVVSFSRNAACGSGGAINAAETELRVARGIFADNTSGANGGAVFINNTSALHSTLANALFVRNEAQSGSAFYGDDADFINSTVDSNKGQAIVNAAPHTPGHIRFVNSIVSNNPQGGCGPAGLFDDGGANLQFPATGCGASIAVADPRLDSFYIPIPNSPPRRKGDLSVCMSSPINGRDVYGLGRPSGGACTIGAAEGDIDVIYHQRKGPQGGCDCGAALIKQLRRFIPGVQ